MSRASAVVLLSGGLDSTTVLAIAKSEGFTPYALSFRYGQRHAVELEAAAARRRRAQGVARHVVADIDLRVFGGSALTADIDVPKHESADELDRRRHPGHLRPGAQHHLPVVRARLRRDRRRHRHLHRRQRARLLRLPRLPPRVHRRLRDDGEPRHPRRRRRRTAHDPHPADLT